jgi:CheY-like chemotaxis protein
MRKYSILLVDDDPLITKGTGDDLEGEGYEVTTADGGEKAIELLENATFDLVITDLVMGPINGIGVLQEYCH